ncbi:hypothetical protein AN958_12317, partial [Leucoagaricus sp. SymC.cos]
DLLKTLPELSPFPPSFLPSIHLTKERMEELGLLENEFLWKEERRLVARVLVLNEMGLVWDETEKGLNVIQQWLGIHFSPIGSEAYLPASKSFLKLIDIPYIRQDGSRTTSDQVEGVMRASNLSNHFILVGPPQVVRNSKSSDTVTAYFKVWDSQRGTRATNLIGHSLQFGHWTSRVMEASANPGASLSEGNDVFAIAGTRYGKSLVYGLLAITAAIAQLGSIVIVISPLKALQKDQVQWFNKNIIIVIDGKPRELLVTAIAINKDSHEKALFIDLEKG